MDSFVERIRKYEPFFGQWTLGEEIGRGSFGRVFTVYKTGDDGQRSVAVLKVISIPQSQEELDSLRRSYNGRDDMVRAKLYKDYQYSVNEIDTMEKLNGTSNVVYFEDKRIYDRDDMFGWDILIRMELLVRLDNWFREDARRRDLRNIYRIWNDLYEGLKVCETFGIVHMDIKPENIFYSPAIDYFKLGDFGEAQVIDPQTGLAAKGKTVGSYSYMSPEVEARRGATFASDIYSLGLVMYQLLNDDTLPFAQKGAVLTDRDHERINRMRWSGQPIPRLKNVPKEFMNYILVCLDPDPNKRYSSAAQAQEALRALWYTFGMSQHSASRKWIMLGSGLIVLAGAVVALGVMSSRGGGQRPSETATPAPTAVETTFVTEQAVIPEDAGEHVTFPPTPTPTPTDTPTPIPTDTPTPSPTPSPTPEPRFDAEAVVVMRDGASAVREANGSYVADLKDGGIDMSVKYESATNSLRDLHIKAFDNDVCVAEYRDGRLTNDSAWNLGVALPDRSNSFLLTLQSRNARVEPGSHEIRFMVGENTEAENGTALTVDLQVIDSVWETAAVDSLPMPEQPSESPTTVPQDTPGPERTPVPQTTPAVDLEWSHATVRILDQENMLVELSLEHFDDATMEASVSVNGSAVDAKAEGGVLSIPLSAEGAQWHDPIDIDIELSGDGWSTRGQLNCVWVYSSANGGSFLPHLRETVEGAEGIHITDQSFIVDGRAAGSGDMAFAGTAEPYLTLDVMLSSVNGDSMPLDAIRVDASGAWSMTLSPDLLDDGMYYMVTFSYAEAAAQGTASSDTFRYYAPIDVPSVDFTRVTNASVTGSTKPNAGVSLHRTMDDTAMAEARANANGRFTLDMGRTFEESGVQAGEELYLHIVDEAGNERWTAFSVAERDRKKLEIEIPAALSAQDGTVMVPRADFTWAIFKGDPGREIYILTDGNRSNAPRTLSENGTLEIGYMTDDPITLRVVYADTDEKASEEIRMVASDEPLVTLDDGVLNEQGQIVPESTSIAGAVSTFGDVRLGGVKVELFDVDEDVTLARASVRTNGEFALTGLALEPEHGYILSVYKGDDTPIAEVYITTAREKTLSVMTPIALSQDGTAITVPDTQLIGLRITGEPNAAVRVKDGDEDTLVTLDGEGRGAYAVQPDGVRTDVTLSYEGLEKTFDYSITIDGDNSILSIDGGTPVKPEATALTGRTYPMTEVRLHTPDGALSVTTDEGGVFVFEDVALLPEADYTLELWDDEGALGRVAFATAKKALAPLQVYTPCDMDEQERVIELPAADRYVLMFAGEPNKMARFEMGTVAKSLSFDDDGVAMLTVSRPAETETTVRLAYATEDEGAVEYALSIGDDALIALDGAVDGRATSVSGRYLFGVEALTLVKAGDGAVLAQADSDETGAFRFDGIALEPDEAYVIRAPYGETSFAVGGVTYADLSIALRGGELLEDGSLLSDGGETEIVVKGEPGQQGTLTVDGEEYPLTFDENGEDIWKVSLAPGAHVLQARYIETRWGNDAKDADLEAAVHDGSEWQAVLDDGNELLPGSMALTGVAAPGATVRLERDGDAVATAEADGYGAFTFEERAYQAGERFDLTVSYLGRKQVAGQVSVGALGDITIARRAFDDGTAIWNVEDDVFFNLAGIPGKKVLLWLDDERCGDLTFSGWTEEYTLHVAKEGTHTLRAVYADDDSSTGECTFTVDEAHRSLTVDELLAGEQILRGTAVPNASVTIRDQTLAVTVADDGTFAFDAMSYAEGETLVLVQNYYGFKLSETTVTVEGWQPIAITSDAGRQVLSSAQGLHVEGTAQAGAQIVCAIADAYSAAADVGEDGRWTFDENERPEGLGDGEWTLTFAYPDGAPAQASLDVTVDTECYLEVDELREDHTALTGRTEPGARIELREEDSPTNASATANEDGSFSIDVRTAFDLGRRHTVIATDIHGNTAEATVETLEADRAAAFVDVSSGTLTMADRTLRLRVTGEDGMAVAVTAQAGDTVLFTEQADITDGEATLEHTFEDGEIPAGTHDIVVTAAYADGFGRGGAAQVDVDMDGPVFGNIDYKLGARTISGTVSGAIDVTLDGATDLEAQTAGEGEPFGFRLEAPIEAGKAYTLTAVDEAGNTTTEVIQLEEAASAVPEGGIRAEIEAEGGLQPSYAVGDELVVTGSIVGMGEDSISGVKLVDAGTGEGLYTLDRRDVRDYVTGEGAVDHLPVPVNAALAGHSVRIDFVLSRAGDIASELVFSCGEADNSAKLVSHIGASESYGFDPDQGTAFDPGSMILLTGWHYATDADKNYALENVEIHMGAQLIKSIPLKRDGEGVDLAQNGGWGTVSRSSYALYAKHRDEGVPSLAGSSENGGFYVYFDPTRVQGVVWLPGQTYTIRLKVVNSSTHQEDVISIDIAISEGARSIRDVESAMREVRTAWNQEMLQYQPVVTATPTP